MSINKKGMHWLTSWERRGSASENWRKNCRNLSFMGWIRKFVLLRLHVFFSPGLCLDPDWRQALCKARKINGYYYSRFTSFRFRNLTDKTRSLFNFCVLVPEKSSSWFCLSQQLCPGQPSTATDDSRVQHLPSCQELDSVTPASLTEDKYTRQPKIIVKCPCPFAYLLRFFFNLLG